MTPSSSSSGRRLRRFASLTLLFSFLSSLVTGVVCYITPTGRVAHWTGWVFLGLEKESWQEVHTTTSIIMLLAFLIHFWLNWGPIKHYLKRGATLFQGATLELLLALLLVVVTWVGTLQGWQPFLQIARWNGEIKSWWEEHSAQAPRPHAEDATLATVADDYGMTVSELMAKLTAAGFPPAGEEEVVGALAERHGLSAAEMMKRALGRRRGGDRGAGRGAGRGAEGQRGGGGEGGAPDQGGEHRGDGSGRGEGQARSGGYGRMTLDQLCRREGIDLQAALKWLAARGITAAPTTRLRTVAEKLGLHPREAATALRGGRE